MLICPQCKSKNPHTNNFCQSCGVSLTDEIAKNGKGNKKTNMLWAIIKPAKNSQRLIELTHKKGKKSQLEVQNLADFFNLPQGSNTNWQRYVFDDLDRTFAEAICPNDCISGKIIDLQPLQQTHLASIRQQHREKLDNLQSNSNGFYLSLAHFWNSLSVPSHALPYLTLERHTPIVPKVYEACQLVDGGVTLIEDRSQWQLLTEFWSSEELPLAQVVWFLDEIAKLWTPLCKIGCSSSLLTESNLRVDEDGAFCLQQLFVDKPQDTPSLKNLVRTWQTWLSNLEDNYRQKLDPIFKQVTSGEIREIEQLRSQLQNLDSDLDTEELHITSEENNFFDDELDRDDDADDRETLIYSMQLDSIIDAGCTNVGSQRKHNEDFYAIETSIIKQENSSVKNFSFRGLYVVCDGMGGHAAGEVASAMAGESILDYFRAHWHDELPDAATIEAGILLANNTIYQTNINNSSSGSARMGTTLAMALLHDCQLAIAHVGDSRIYRLTRKHGLELLTSDHEVGQREINRGVEVDIAYGRPDAYQLTQALGPRDNSYVRPEIQFLEITEDCLLLICSDGLSDFNFVENHWEQYLEPLISSQSDLEAGLVELIELANQHNGHDNITGISIKIKLKPEF
ncbi:serine/threonine phosphatase [Myxosarcina sp. GI1]|uniref:serine/threonine phosphatase n=1 Tax=Myxosarcina sp. GI1 TaxID=1541065 RepID=UPI000565D5D8|nr:serine/threonine phosphatase [Myxosarcina sp. GI1]